MKSAIRVKICDGCGVLLSLLNQACPVCNDGDGEEYDFEVIE